MDRIAFIMGETFVYWSAIILTLAAATAACAFVALYLGRTGKAISAALAVPMALVFSLIMARFMGTLREQGVENLQGINPYVMSMERETPLGKRRPNHIILFAKNQMGLRNLYQLPLG